MRDSSHRLKPHYSIKLLDGQTDMDDLLRDRIANLKRHGELARAAYDRTRAGSRSTEGFATKQIEAFSKFVRQPLQAGEIPFRKAYLQAIIYRIEVDDRFITICGRKSALERTVLASAAAKYMVGSSIAKWRSRQDSNL